MCHCWYRGTIAMVSGGGLPHFHIIHTPGRDCCMNQGSFITPFTTCFLLCLIIKVFVCIKYFIRIYPGISFSKPDCCSCPRRLILGELDRQKSRGKISRNPAGKMRKSSEIDQSAISQPPPQFVTQT